MARSPALGSSTVVARIRSRIVFNKEVERDQDLAPLVEKLYFHELDRKENFSERLQVPMVMLIAIAGFIGQMLQNLERGLRGIWSYSFFGSIALSVICFLAALFFLERVLKGYSYSYIENGNAWKSHHKRCVAQYESYADAAKLTSNAMRNALVESYIDCSSRNAVINDNKSYYLYRFHRAIVSATAFALAGYLCFYFGELDKSLKSADQRVLIVNPITVEGQIMTTQKPPPPPPPPPTRQVRENHKPRPVPPPARGG